MHPHNLPTQLTSIIGRAREIAEVKRLPGAARLVTLTGSGGAGKTRLALQVAADMVDGYPDGNGSPSSPRLRIPPRPEDGRVRPGCVRATPP